MVSCLFLELTVKKIETLHGKMFDVVIKTQKSF